MPNNTNDPSARYQRYVETSLEGIWELDASGRTLYTNPRVQEMLGLSGDELRPTKALDFLHPEDRPKAEEEWDLRLRGHSSVREYRFRRKDGSYLWVQVSATPTLNDQGEVVGAFAMLSDISEKHRLQETLKRSEQLNRSILESIQDCIKVLDIEGRIVSINRNGLLALGIQDDKEILGRKWVDFWQGEDRVAAEKALCVAMSGGTGRVVGSISQNQQTRWWDVAITPFEGADGAPQQLLAISREVTEQKRIENELRRKEKIYRAIGESIRYGIWICDTEGRNIYASDSFLNLLGITQAECAEFNWGRYLHPDDIDATLAAWKECVRTGSVWDREHRFLGTDGQWHTLLARGVPIKDDDGKVLCWAGINLDISALKKSEESLRQSEVIVAAQFAELETLETRQRIILENLPIGVWFLNHEGHMIYGNKAGKDIWRGAKYVGLDDLHLYKAWWHETGMPIKPEDWAGAQVVRDRKPCLNQMLDIECFDGSRKTIINTAVPVTLENGTFFGAVVFNLDVTERARAEAALRESHASLEQRIAERTAKLQETIGDLEAFSYSMSHDMRAPLRAMFGFSEILLMDYSDKLDAAGQDFLRRIDSGARRLDLLVTDVLTYSRIAKENFARVPVDLDSLVKDLITHYPEFQEPRAKVMIIGTLGMVAGHEAFLSQIFSNLISNAVKFQKPGAQPVVQLRSENVDDRVKVWVEDNGIGIAPEHFERIFAMFGRVYGKNEFEGTGIGLAIVRKAAERMGAQIGLESTLHKGSKFWISFARS